MVRAAAAVQARPYKYTHERVGKFQVFKLRQFGLDSNIINIGVSCRNRSRVPLNLTVVPLHGGAKFDQAARVLRFMHCDFGIHHDGKYTL